MNKLYWTGTVQSVTMIDIARPDILADDITQVLTGLASDAAWTAAAGNGKLIGTNDNDLVFLDDDAFTTPRLEGITAFSMRGGNDVVDLTSSRFTYGNAKIDGGDGNDWLFSGAGKDKLLGGAGEDRLNGGDGKDVIIGGANRDFLAGGAGKDIFFFGDQDGRDNIYDFTTAGKGHDVIDLSASNIITDFADLMANHVMVEDGELKITMTDGNYIRLYGLQPSDLLAQDFHF
jgi:Ca2+-binding RTX toxin-like protein